MIITNDDYDFVNLSYQLLYYFTRNENLPRGNAKKMARMLMTNKGLED